MRSKRIDNHEECPHFKEAEVVSEKRRTEEYSHWEDEYISTNWSCGCYYYEEHERCPGNQCHDQYYDCSGCKMVCSEGGEKQC